MTLRVIWRPQARQNLHEIIGYIAERQPAAALRLGDAIAHTADRLPDHPYLHRPGVSPERARQSSTPITFSSIV